MYSSCITIQNGCHSASLSSVNPKSLSLLHITVVHNPTSQLRVNSLTSNYYLNFEHCICNMYMIVTLALPHTHASRPGHW